MAIEAFTTQDGRKIPIDAFYDGGDQGCDQLLIEIAVVMEKLAPGQTLLVQAYDPAAPLDIAGWCHKTGNILVQMFLAEQQFLLRKG